MPESKLSFAKYGFPNEMPIIWQLSRQVSLTTNTHTLKSTH